MTRAITLLFHDVFVDDPAESGFVSAAANRYKLSRTEMGAQLQGVAAVRRDAPCVCDGAGVRECGGAGAEAPSTVAPSHSRTPALLPWLLTVDDGGTSYYTQLADRLEAFGWRGHAFVPTDFIGRRGFMSAAQLRELDARGHVIGSHSATHRPWLSAQPFEVIYSEWARSRAVLEDVLGHAVTVASVPGGFYSRIVARAAAEAGIRTLFTSEPVTTRSREAGCLVIGRFNIGHGARPDMARALVAGATWPRAGAWASWNAKGLVKPLLGPWYGRIADSLHARSAS